MNIYKTISILAFLGIVGCASEPVESSAQLDRKWLSRDGFKYSSRLTPSDVDQIVDATRKTHPSKSYQIRMISALGESATVHMTDAGKLTSFYPYQVYFMKSGNNWKRENPTTKSTLSSEGAPSDEK